MEQVINENDFAKGFNHSIILAEFRPELLNEIIPSINPTNTYFDGFFAGKEQWEVEQTNQQLQKLNSLREKGRSNEMDLER
jgi:hypothetical protein